MSTVDTSMTLWVITKDHINVRDGEEGRRGYGQTLRDTNATLDSFEFMFGRTIFMSTEQAREAIPGDKRIKWKSYDDDGELYYEGVIHADAFLNLGMFEDVEDDFGYEVDRFCMEDAGAVHTVYNRADIAKHKPDYAARHSGSSFGDEWLEIYG